MIAKKNQIFFIFACCFLLSLPMFGAFVTTLNSDALQEHRVMAKFDYDFSIESMVNFPKNITKWIDDNFGFRSEIISTHNNLYFTLFRDIPRFQKQVTVGSDGYIFLGSHSTRFPNSLLNIDSLRIFNDAYYSKLITIAENAHPSITFLAVPTKHILDVEYYPWWFKAHGERNKLRYLDRLGKLEQKLPNFVSSYAEANKIQKKYQLIPKTFFHWEPGVYTELLVRLSVEKMFGIDIVPPQLTLSKVLKKSDITHLYPGVSALKSYVEIVNYRNLSKNINVKRYFPTWVAETSELEALLTETLLITNNIKNANTRIGKRIFLLTDSFGWNTRYDLLVYFDEIVLMNQGRFNALPKIEREKYLKKVLDAFNPEKILVLMHLANFDLETLNFINTYYADK